MTKRPCRICGQKPARARGLCDADYRRWLRRQHGLAGATPMTRYPWDSWLDGEAHILIPGEDFTTSIKSMENQIRDNAYARGLVASVRLLIDGRLLVISVSQAEARITTNRYGTHKE